MGRPMVFACSILLVGMLVGCTTRTSAVEQLASMLPAELAQDGAVIRAGGAGEERLLDLLGLDADEVRATARAGQPSVRALLTNRTADVAEVLQAAGFAAEDAGAGTVWRRTAETDGFVGVPAVGLVEGMAVVADGPQAVDLVAEPPADPLAVVAGGDAVVAVLLAPPAGGAVAEDIPSFAQAALVLDGDGAGRLRLDLREEGDQDDAVAVAVALRTRGAVTPDGRSLLMPGEVITRGSVIDADVAYALDPADGVTSDLLDVLRR